jgi:hypothetical protein
VPHSSQPQPPDQGTDQSSSAGPGRSVIAVSLTGSRSPIWRRLLLPTIVTLADLHQVILVLFGWDGDHPHVFQAGQKQ